MPLSNVAFGVLSTLGNVGEAAISNRDRPRYGNALFGSFGRDFMTADGRRIMIVAITRRQWTGLLRVLELEAEIAVLEKRLGVNFEADEGERFIHRDELFVLVQQRVGGRHFENLTEAFDHLAVCWGEYNTVYEALGSDLRLSTANPMFERISHPSGETYIAAGFPGIVPNVERASVRPAPRLGAHTDEILADELGVTEGEIARLHDGGLVAGP